ncbi:PREDICTED: elongation of very long chain fatty acids protein AAEL008004-like [Drosophila arizonae]|uniref:Elongation of very long chain fatty acids protein n=1 Tax=Drosophila arizonae TaxID=7263 RepID=A0ABM1NLG1_DROAR|nr:PREDICTED: elongation of very long chain fatty acids protein AAEL008004-like [Drosophila arizonae]
MFEVFNRPPADPLELPLAVGPWPAILIVAAYLLFVLKVGRQFMEHRQPYDLNKVLKVYNLIQIVYNGALFIFISYVLLVLKPYKLSCIMVLPMDHPVKPFEQAVSYAYYLNKILDLMDTVFMVLRKNYRQITMLHLLHHSIMVVAVYAGIRFNGYGGHFTIMGTFNVFVHAVMYSYYYISSQKRTVSQNPTWKQYITILQMIQFFTVMLHSVYTLMQPNCDVPLMAIAAVLAMGSLMVVMFTNFYIHTYILPKKAKQK